MEENNKNYIGNIDFTDPVTLATIGDWTRINGATIGWLYSMIDRKDEGLNDIIREKYTEEVALDVTERFYNYLTQSGFDIKGKVSIKGADYSDRNRGCVYNLHLDDEDKDLEVILFSGNEDHMDTISISDGKIKREYEIISRALSKKMDLYYTGENTEYRRYYRNYGVGYEYINGEDDVYVKVDFPRFILDRINPPKEGSYLRTPLVFDAEKENKLKEYYTNLTFPIDIEKVLVDVCEMTFPKGTNYHQYDEISIEACKRTFYHYGDNNEYSRYEYDVSDKIVVRKGKMVENTRNKTKAQEKVEISYVSEEEQNRLDKIELANKYDLDLSLVDGPDQNFWDAVWDADNKMSKKR